MHVSHSHNAMPALGMGTFRLQDDVAYQSVKLALQLGYRHIDTAQIYGNEAEVGRAIKDSGVPRDELFITTKVWNDKLNADGFIPSVKESLSKLGLDQVDLLLIHWPAPQPQVAMAEYLTELKKAKAQGLTKHIGVSNFTVALLTEALQTLSASEIFTNQVEVHPYLTNETLRRFCNEQGVHVTGYMPFAVGKVLQDDSVIAIARQYQRSPAEVVIAWELAHGLATIPSSTKEANLRANLNALSLTLSPEHIKQLDALNRNDRQANPDFSPQWDE